MHGGKDEKEMRREGEGKNHLRDEKTYENGGRGKREIQLIYPNKEKERNNDGEEGKRSEL